MKVKDFCDNLAKFFDHLVLRNSVLVHPESAPSVHPRMHFLTFTLLEAVFQKQL